MFHIILYQTYIDNQCSKFTHKVTELILEKWTLYGYKCKLEVNGYYLYHLNILTTCRNATNSPKTCVENVWNSPDEEYGNIFIYKGLYLQRSLYYI